MKYMLKYGLYEQVINKILKADLDNVSDDCKYISDIDEAEASQILSNYLLEIIKQGLDNVADNGGKIDSQVELVNQIISLVKEKTNESSFSSYGVDNGAKQLLALLSETDPRFVVGKKAKDIIRPETSIAESSLFTGAIHEPQMYNEIKKEIVSANKIDMLVSFVKWSGLRLIIDELRSFVQDGGKLRIITTSYMGATDIKAIEELRKLPNTEIKISYDTKRTRLHAKTYVFYRDTEFTTAYVGSSNMSNAAMTSGLEWNIKISKIDQPAVMDKIQATFESYWNSNDFETYNENEKERLACALRKEKYFDNNDENEYVVDVTPYSYQQEILDKLDAERKVRGYYRNLVVAATGCGKTIISAFDYKRYKEEHPDRPCRLLFVAHREEILKQSLFAFRSVLKDANFGELYYGGHKPESVDYLFLSKDTFYSQKEKFMGMGNDYYDFIIVDEFHHAAAPRYKVLLEFYNPKILLGLTATPERMDGQNILSYFDDRIAAEIRLPEAIDRKLLCPFQYFGVTDSIDLSGLRWSRGGYEKSELNNVYVFSEKIAENRASLVITSLIKYVTDMNDVKGLGFCVSMQHAKFMADYFNKNGIPSAYLTSESNDETRKKVKETLISGKIRFIFVVDLYNEGVDIPQVNTILFLRPTESLTVFMQQLGRGLRLYDGKECLTVLDFIGQSNKKYNFEDKYEALLSNTNHSIIKEIKNGFVDVPKGCFIKLEKVASKYILDNIKAAIGNSAGIVSRIATFTEDTDKVLNLCNYLDYYHLDPRNIYKYSSFSRLMVRAGVRDDFNEELEDTITKALARLSIIDSRRWITFLIDLLQNYQSFNYESMSPLNKRMFQMFYVTIWEKTYDDSSVECQNNMFQLFTSKVLLNEILELLDYKYNKIDFVDEEVDLGFDSPLDLYCTYTRNQLLVAMDYMKPSTIREGTKYLEDKKIDVFMITLNKSDKDYSPSTLYKDYSISDRLFHWQSQSTTSAESQTGQRYINHRKTGNRIILFVRENKKDTITGIAEGYTFLGLADYVSHNGSRPINFVWKLHRSIPAKFIKKTNKLVAR